MSRRLTGAAKVCAFMAEKALGAGITSKELALNVLTGIAILALLLCGETIGEAIARLF